MSEFWDPGETLISPIKTTGFLKIKLHEVKHPTIFPFTLDVCLIIFL